MREVMYRPRTYADRQWVEGWLSVVAWLPARRAWYCKCRLTFLRLRAYYGRLTAKERGEADAIMDAFGC